MKGRPFRDHLYLAANVQMLSTQPLSIDFSPMIGYRFNKLFLAGIGGNYRQTFKDSIPMLSPSVLGYKAFASYDLLRSFFMYGEFDRNSPGLSKAENGVKRVWKNAAFVGIGRRFIIHPKLEVTLLFMYNFLHENNDLVYPNAWNVKVGFQSSELGFLKRRK
jgi:hypothetical protein